MPGMDDFHAFQSTGGGSGGGGLPSGCLGWVIGILAILCLLGKLAA